jgi:hypothetical protein
MHRTLQTPSRPGAGQAGSLQPRSAAPAVGRPGSRSAGRPLESARLGIRCHGRPMQPATLRVLETTWRVWREPLA